LIAAALGAALGQIPTPPPPESAPADAAAVPSPIPSEKPPVYEGLTPQRLARVQGALQRGKLDGWLFYDFRRSDEIAYRLLGLDPAGARSRRWYCLVRLKDRRGSSSTRSSLGRSTACRAPPPPTPPGGRAIGSWARCFEAFAGWR